jgi:septum formation protein
MVKIILASASPRRIELLKRIGLDFEAIPSNVDEDTIPKTKPVAYVKKLAKMKARAVAKQVNEGVIIGADTVVCINDRIIGKPKDREEAIKTLKELSGKSHLVVSGVCVINKYSKKTVTKASKATLRFRELNDRIIDWYLKAGESEGFAGSYAIQGKGAVLADSIKGDYYAIVGLPLSTLYKILEDMGVL